MIPRHAMLYSAILNQAKTSHDIGTCNAILHAYIKVNYDMILNFRFEYVIIRGFIFKPKLKFTY